MQTNARTLDERDELQAKVDELQARVDELQEQLEAAYAKNRALRSHISNMQQGRNGWHVKAKKLQAKLDVIADANEDYRRKIDELERENSKLSSDEFYLRCTLVDINGEVIS